MPQSASAGRPGIVMTTALEKENQYAEELQNGRLYWRTWEGHFGVGREQCDDGKAVSNLP